MIAKPIYKQELKGCNFNLYVFKEQDFNLASGPVEDADIVAYKCKRGKINNLFFIVKHEDYVLYILKELEELSARFDKVGQYEEHDGFKYYTILLSENNNNYA